MEPSPQDHVASRADAPPEAEPPAGGDAALARRHFLRKAAAAGAIAWVAPTILTVQPASAATRLHSEPPQPPPVNPEPPPVSLGPVESPSGPGQPTAVSPGVLAFTGSNTERLAAAGVAATVAGAAFLVLGGEPEPFGPDANDVPPTRYT